jgi:hypothetical protein
MKRKKGGMPTDITVKFEHLNPKVQEIIWKYEQTTLEETATKHPLKIGVNELKKHFNYNTIKGSRRMRGAAELVVGINVLGVFLQKGRAFNANLFSANLTGGVLGAAGSVVFAAMIKYLHTKLVDSIKEKGLLQTRFEGKYPQDWINATSIAKTHPSFHVKANGDIVFHRTTRMEYFRIKFQERFKVAGWRWRALLGPPLAPKKVRDLVKAQIQKIAKKIPKTAPKPIPAPAAARKKTETMLGKRRKFKIKFA